MYDTWRWEMKKHHDIRFVFNKLTGKREFTGHIAACNAWVVGRNHDWLTYEIV